MRKAILLPLVLSLMLLMVVTSPASAQTRLSANESASDSKQSVPLIDVPNLAIQSAGLLAAYITIFIGVFGNYKRKQQDAFLGLQKAFEKELEEQKAAHTKEFENLRTQHKDDVADLRVQLANERADRVQKTANIHARIDEMQNEMIGTLRADMSEIKGKLDAFSNIMTIVQQWFVNQNGSK